jgi:mRNA-degrading endonuclease RelE of RelBE toxin-antitoxin system
VNNIEVYQIEPYEDFNRQAQYYVKKRKYRHLPKQIQDLTENLIIGNFDSSTTPPLLHSDIPMPYDVYKMRMANPDAGEGKSGGYRIIYMIKTVDKVIVLLTIYTKSDKDNISDKEIAFLVDGYFMSQLPEED